MLILIYWPQIILFTIFTWNKDLFFSSLLKEIFPRSRTLCWQKLTLSILKILLSVASWIAYLWRKHIFLPMAALRCFFLCPCFSAILLWCFRCVFLLTYLHGFCRMSLICALMPFVSFGKFLTINFFNISYLSFSLFSSLAL